jgi:hypothetical protein
VRDRAGARRPIDSDAARRFDRCPLGRLERVKIFSEYWPLKYLVSEHGMCLGVDTKRRSYLILLHHRGIMFRRRPAGDTIVEDLHYEIPAIVSALNRAAEGMG